MANLFSSRASESLGSREAWGPPREDVQGTSSHADPRRSLSAFGIQYNCSHGLGMSTRGSGRVMERKTGQMPAGLSKAMGASAGAISAGGEERR